MPYDTGPLHDAVREIRRLEAVETAQADEILGLSHEIDAARGEIDRLRSPTDTPEGRR